MKSRHEAVSARVSGWDKESSLDPSTDADGTDLMPNLRINLSPERMILKPKRENHPKV
jgi:hypothetical protein